jgi:hypothetical protein
MNLRRTLLSSVATAVVAMAFTEAAAQTASSASSTPLPNGKLLLQRAIANESNLAAELERISPTPQSANTLSRISAS